MTDKVHTLRAAGVDQRADVPNQFGRSVIPAACRSGAAGVTPLVRCETAIAPSGEFWDHEHYGNLLPFANFNRIHAVPPCNVTDDEVAEALRILDAALDVADEHAR